MAIHPLAVVDSTAKLGRNVEIGPFVIIERDVILGDNCVLDAFAIVKQGVTIGDNNHIYERATIGGLPQHTRMPEQVGRVVIGSNNTIRENCTIHRALHADHETIVGNDNLLMVGVHVAHDCVVGSNTIFANNAMLGGHVVVEDRAYVSGNVAVHQFCRIGSFAMLGGLARVVKDVPPYVTVDGASGYVVGLNTVGLRRVGYTVEQIAEMKAAYRVIYRSGLKWSEILDILQNEFSEGPAAAFGRFLPLVTRGIVNERRLPPGATVRLSEEATIELRPQARAG